jgi:DNA-binding PucR family transcriptional regulator
MKSVLLKEPMQEILNCCSEYFQDQVVLFDDMLNIIDFSSNYPPDDDDAIWKEMCQTKKRSEKLFQQTRKMNPQFDPIDSPCSELIDPGDGYPRNLYNSFYDSARRFASLMILENNKPISLCQLKLLDYISELIGSSLADRCSMLHGSVENLRAVFVMFLNKFNVDPAIVSRCLALKSWGMRDDYRLILVNFPEVARNADTLTRYLYIYENIFPDCLGFKYIESIVIVIRYDTEEVMSRCMPKFERQLKMHNAVCGVSLPFNSIQQINSQYVNANTAIQFSDKIQRVCYLKDILTSYLINKIASDTPLIPLCSREAVRIYDYDIENGTKLLLTLETYLRQNKSQKAAADELFICRSTLAYRLRCIDKLVKFDYDDSNERLHLLLSCIVLRNIGNSKVNVVPISKQDNG